jgi:AraC family transcriptional regulator of adaptative response / DNA-3-methyladenine glycosylase II
VTAHGKPLDAPVGTVTHLFPRAVDLLDADPGALAMPESRRRTIRALAEVLANGELVLDPGADREQTVTALLAVPGIGPWTAAYVRMRALGDPDAFMPSDLGVHHAIDKLGLPADPASAEALSHRWKPWRAYALQHLWASLNEKDEVR